MQKLSYLAVTIVLGCVSVCTATAQTSDSARAASNLERRMAIPSAAAMPSDAASGISPAAMTPARPYGQVAATRDNPVSSAAPPPAAVSAGRTQPAMASANPNREASLISPNATNADAYDRKLVAAVSHSLSSSTASITSAAAPQSKQLQNLSPASAVQPPAFTSALPAATASPTARVSAARAIPSASAQKAAMPKTPNADIISRKGPRDRSK